MPLILALILATALLSACAPVPAHQQLQTHHDGSVAKYATEDGIRIAYQTYGRETGPPLVLLNGVGQATRFDNDPLTQALVEKGFHVIRMDNRDSGLSSRVKQSETDSRTQPAYGLEDMAADVALVLKSEDIASAHVMGISLGGMISQVFASTYPEKTLSLISVSSTTGKPGLKFGPAMAYLQVPPALTPEKRKEQVKQLYPHFAGSRYPMTENEIESRATADLHHDDPMAAVRQGMAANSSGDRSRLLGNIKAPALVIHGSADALFPAQHGKETAKAIPSAKLNIIDGMGHAVSDAAAEPVAQAIYNFVHSIPR